MIHSKTERNIVCVIAKEQQAVCKTASVDRVKQTWRTRLNMHKCLKFFYKCLQLKETNSANAYPLNSNIRIEVAALLTVLNSIKWKSTAAAVTVTNISSKLLISRRWQLITIHTSGKYLEHTKCAHTCGYTHTVLKALHTTLFVNVLNGAMISFLGYSPCSLSQPSHLLIWFVIFSEMLRSVYLITTVITAVYTKYIYLKMLNGITFASRTKPIQHCNKLL